MKPLVSVVLLTYNHERYIRKAIDSVLSQQCDFAIELIVTEDCSTDETWNIVQDYVARNPDSMSAIRSLHNLNTNEVTTRALRIARGEFVAFLDGDDYWTCPEKLVRQVAYLRADPFCSMCAHDAEIVNEVEETLDASFRQSHPAPAIGTYADLLNFNYIAGPTPMIRRTALCNLPHWFQTAEFGDWSLYLIAAQYGHIGYMAETMAAYRRHDGGYWSGMTYAHQLDRLIAFQDTIARHGPQLWQAAFCKARDRQIEGREAALAAFEASQPLPVALDLQDLGREGVVASDGRKALDVAVTWGPWKLGSVIVPVDKGEVAHETIARTIATSAIGWKALATVFERTRYPHLTYTRDGEGFTAWWEGVAVAHQLPEPGPDRRLALHEMADWLILIREAVAGPSRRVRLVLPFFRNRSTDDELDSTSIDIAQPMPALVGRGRQLKAGLYLRKHHLKDCILEYRKGIVQSAVIDAACFDLGYELAEAAIMLGVIGHAHDDTRTLRQRLRLAKREWR